MFEAPFFADLNGLGPTLVDLVEPFGVADFNLSPDTDDRTLESDVEGDWWPTRFTTAATGSLLLVVPVSHGLTTFHRSDQLQLQSR